MNKMFGRIKALESKLQRWELQLQSNNVAHFPILRTEKPTYIKKYAEENSDSPTRIQISISRFLKT
jgi:hypothetical protein